MGFQSKKVMSIQCEKCFKHLKRKVSPHIIFHTEECKLKGVKLRVPGINLFSRGFEKKKKTRKGSELL